MTRTSPKRLRVASRLAPLLIGLSAASTLVAQEHTRLDGMMVIRYSADHIRLSQKLLASLASDKRWSGPLEQALQQASIASGSVRVVAVTSEEQPRGVYAGEFQIQLRNVKSGTLSEQHRIEAFETVAKHLRRELGLRLYDRPRDRLEQRRTMLERDIQARLARAAELRGELPDVPPAADEDLRARLNDVEMEFEAQAASHARLSQILESVEGEAENLNDHARGLASDRQALKDMIDQVQRQIAEGGEGAGDLRQQVEDLCRRVDVLTDKEMTARAKVDANAQRMADLVAQLQSSALQQAHLGTVREMILKRLGDSMNDSEQRARMSQRRAVAMVKIEALQREISRHEDQLEELAEQIASLRPVEVEVW